MKTKMTDNFSTDAMLVMIGLCELMTKHGIKPSLSKSREVQNPSMAITWEIPDASKNVIERNFNRAE